MVKLIIQTFVVALIIYIAIAFDVYRWHSFQEITHSNIGYWKWHLLFGHTK
jgi:hypothetical protein